MSESTKPTMTRDDSETVVHDQLAAAQARVDDLQEKLDEAEARTAEANREVRTQQGLIAGLQESIRGGDIDAADKHSRASAELNAMGRDKHNYDQARLSLRAQLADAQFELDLYTAIYGHTDMISEQDRAAELAEAQVQIKAILDPLIRKYRKSDAAYDTLASSYKRYLRSHPEGLQGVMGTGPDRAQSLIFDDRTKLDDSGQHHAKRVAERALTNIMADIKAEIRGDKEPRNS